MAQIPARYGDRQEQSTRAADIGTATAIGRQRLVVFFRLTDFVLEARTGDFFDADFFDGDFLMRNIDAAPRFAFLAVVPTDFGMLPAISFALAPATPPTTAPTAAPSGPTIEPAAAPAAAPPTIPKAEADLELLAVFVELAIRETSIHDKVVIRCTQSVTTRRGIIGRQPFPVSF